jgi:hypothetical protein
MARDDVIIRIGGAVSQTLTRSMESVESRISDVKSSVFSLNGALAAVGVGSIFATFLKNSEVQAQALKQVETAVQSTGGAAGYTTDELAAMASALQGVTTYGDEAILAMQSVLLTFTQISGPQFQAATRAVLDMSARLGTDLKSAALQVGKALNDPVKGVTALARAGVSFSAEQKEMIKSLAETNRLAEAQKIILDELNKEFGGSADIKTFGDQVKAVNNAFGDLFEMSVQADDGMRSLIATLQDPGTVAAFQTVGQAVFGLVGALAKGIVKFNELGKSIGYGLARMAGYTDEVDLEKEIAELERLIENSTKYYTEYSDTAIEKMRERLAELKTLRAALAPPIAPDQTPPAAPGRPTPVAPAAPAVPAAAKPASAAKARKTAGDKQVSDTRAQARAEGEIWAAWYAEQAALQEGLAEEAKAAQAAQAEALRKLLAVAPDSAAVETGFYDRLVGPGGDMLPDAKMKVTIDPGDLAALAPELRAALEGELYEITLKANVVPTLLVSSDNDLSREVYADGSTGER